MVLLKTLLTLLSPLLLLPGVYSVQFLGNHTALEEVAGRKIAASSCPQAAPHVNATAVSFAHSKGITPAYGSPPRSSSPLASRIRRTVSKNVSGNCEFCNNSSRSVSRADGGQRNGYANTSTTSTCQHYYTVLNACLIQYNNNQTACADATTGYQDCGDITLVTTLYHHSG